jgi:hypothetical protein
VARSIGAQPVSLSCSARSALPPPRGPNSRLAISSYATMDPIAGDGRSGHVQAGNADREKIVQVVNDAVIGHRTKQLAAASPADYQPQSRRPAGLLPALVAAFRK